MLDVRQREVIARLGGAATALPLAACAPPADASLIKRLPKELVASALDLIFSSTD